MKKFVVALMLGLTLFSAAGIEVFYPETAYAAKNKKTKKSANKKAKSGGKKQSSQGKARVRYSYLHYCKRCGESKYFAGAPTVGMGGLFEPNKCSQGGYHIWVKAKQKPRPEYLYHCTKYGTPVYLSDDAASLFINYGRLPCSKGGTHTWVKD